MNTQLRVLIVEDSESDTALIVRQLEKASYAARYKRVETAREMHDALKEESWDIILSDYNLPQFNAFGALKLLQQTDRDIPFIVVSGTIGEETAVELMKSGAHDYLMKENLMRLAPAVRREIAEARERAERRLAEQALRESENQLRELVKTARDIIFTVTAEGIFSTLNPAFEVLTGWREADWIGRYFTDLIVPEDAPKAVERLEQVIKGRPFGVAELRFQTRDRGELYAEIVATEHIKNGKLVGLLGIARDITERKLADLAHKKAEEALRESEERYRRLVESSPDGIAVYQEGKFVYANAAGLKIIGASKPEDLLGRSVLDVVHPDFHAETMKRVQLVSSGTDVPMLEELLVRLDGTCFDAEVSATATAFNGKPAGQVIVRDVSDRKRAEEALRESEEKYRTFVEQSLEGVGVSKGNQVVFANRAMLDIFGYDTLDEFAAIPLLNHVAPESRPIIAERIEKISRRESVPAHYEYKAIRKDGMIRNLELSGGDITLRKEKYSQVTIRDITDRKRSEESLAQSLSLVEATLESTADGILVVDARGVVTGYNERFVEMWGIPQEFADIHNDERLIKYVLDQLKDPDSFLAKVNELYANPDVDSFDLIEFKDGKIFERYSHPQRIANRPVGRVWSFRDSTRRQRIELALRKSESLLSEATKIARLGPWEFDVANRVFTFNDHFYAIYRTTAEDVGGYTMSSSEYTRRFVHPDDQSIVENEVRKALETPELSYVRHFEHRILYADGEMGYVAVSIFVMKDEKGNTLRSYGVNQDITERKQAEDRLRQSEERYRSLFEINPLPMWLYDPGTLSILAANQAAVDTYGYSREELTSMTIKDVRPPEDVPIVLNFLAKNESSPRNSGVWKHRKKDGSIILVNITSQNFTYDGKSVRLSLLENVTEKLRSEEQLRKLSRAVEQSPASIIITDTRGIMEYVNPRFTELSGYTLEEMQGKNVNVLKSGLTPDEEYKRLWETISAEKEWRGEFHSKKKNGELYWEFASISPITNNEGLVTHYLSVQEDITERKASEKALQESEERYRQFFEDDLTGDYISTIDGELLSCNPAFARIHGFESVAEALATNAKSLYLSDHDWEVFINLVRERRKLEYFEEEAKRKDGKTIYLVSNIIGLFDEKGELVQIKGYTFDDTERRLLEDQLRQSQKMESIGTLAGGIAHDFNNILNNILGFVMQLKKYPEDPMKVMKYCETIEKSALRGAELSSHLLSVSRRKKREEAEVNVVQIIHEITTLCTETFPRTIEVESKVGTDLLHVKGDKGSLYQVLLNLVVNARDAMPSGGKLMIEAENRLVGTEVNPKLLPRGTKRCIEFSVSDTGKGMSDAVREKIFDPFFTTKEPGKGTGLGLSIVYSVVKEHHGTILVESAEGMGSSFKVYLPGLELAPSPQPSRSAATVSTAGSLVLLVDDEAMMQELGRELLEDNGYTVLIAKDGVEAVELYRQRGKEIALVILDLVMPRMDGAQTYMEMKKINDQVKAFFCSGFTSGKAITKLLEKEHLRAIKKPFHPTDFIRMVQQTLQGN